MEILFVWPRINSASDILRHGMMLWATGSVDKPRMAKTLTSVMMTMMRVKMGI